MIIEHIENNDLRLDLIQDKPYYRHTVILIDTNRGITRQHFTMNCYYKAKSVFDELKRVYCLEGGEKP